MKKLQNIFYLFPILSVVGALSCFLDWIEILSIDKNKGEKLFLVLSSFKTGGIVFLIMYVAAFGLFFYKLFNKKFRFFKIYNIMISVSLILLSTVVYNWYFAITHILTKISQDIRSVEISFKFGFILNIIVIVLFFIANSIFLFVKDKNRA